MNTFRKNNKVLWNSSGGTSKGKVIQKITHEIKIKGFTSKASTEHPEYIVKSDKSGKTAIHTPQQLRKV